MNENLTIWINIIGNIIPVCLFYITLFGIYNIIKQYFYSKRKKEEVSNLAFSIIILIQALFIAFAIWLLYDHTESLVSKYNIIHSQTKQFIIWLVITVNIVFGNRLFSSIQKLYKRIKEYRLFRKDKSPLDRVFWRKTLIDLLIIAVSVGIIYLLTRLILLKYLLV